MSSFRISLTPKKEQIMLVDDNPDNLRVASDFLMDYGFEVLATQGGKQAIKTLEKASPDLILLDVVMPEMDGFETCRRLKAWDKTKDIPVIFMTAADDSADQVKGLTLGAVDYITKPMQLDEVVARIKTHLHLRSLTKQLGEQNAQLQEEIRVRQQLELSRRESEQRFRAIFHNTFQFTGLLRPDGTLIETNQTALDFAGMQQADLVGKLFWETWCWTRNQKHIERLKEAIASARRGEFVRYEVDLQGATEVATVDFSLKPIVDEAGIVVLLIAEGRDITQRQQEKLELATAKIALEGQIQRERLLSQITQEIRSSLSHQQIFQTAAEQIGQAFGVSRCLIHTYIEEPIPQIPLVAEYRQPELESMLSWEIPLVGNPHAELVLIQDCAIASDNVYTDSLLEAATPLCSKLGLKSMLAVRTSYQGQPNGLICIHQCDYFRHWTAEEIGLLEAVAAQMGIAIAQASLLEQERQGRIELDQQNHQLQTAIRIRQQVESALRRSEERWQLALKANNDGIWDWNLTTNEVFFSARWKEMLGYQDHEISNHFDEWQTRLHPDDVDRVMNYLQAYLDRKSGQYLIEFRLCCKDGSYKWILARGQALWDETGKPVRMVGSHQDISDRKQSEEQLRFNQQKLSFLLQHTPLAVIEWTPNGEVMAWNQSAERIFGYSASEAVGKAGWNLLVPKSARVQVKKLFAQLLTQQGGFYSINQNLTKSGRTIICEWYNTRLVDAQGAVIGLASMAVDITQRRQRELLQNTQNVVLNMVAQGKPLLEVLRELTIQIDQLTPKLYSSIMLMQEDGKHLRPCAGSRLPQAWVQLTDPLLIGPVVGSCGTAAYFGKRVIVEDITTDPLWADYKDLALPFGFKACWSEPILSDTGKVLGTFAMYFSEKRSPNERELEVIESLGKLSSLIIQRKQSEVALQTAKEAAEAANRTKSKFLASMSHELRTPLNAILGFSQILTRNDSLTPEQREHLGIINRSGEHLLTLINDVLSMSKIEAGRITLTETNFDLLELLNGIEEMLRLKANAKGLQLRFEYPKDLPKYVQSDESKLRQVLINLLGNAIKFTQQGYVNLRVSQESKLENWQPKIPPKQTKNRHFLHFEIADTGPGIAEEEINILFDPFVQTQTGHQSMEGTGLGLPISRQFVRLMGGNITVSSQLGRGSIFCFDIEVREVISADVETRVPRQRVVGLEPNQPNYRILVVEDIADNRRLLVEMLQPLGFEICEAVNGEEAVILWQSWQPHLILMDIRMPGMNGYEATQAIKQMPNGQNTVIIALTASAFDEQRVAILKAGCDDFIRKPFREEFLLAKIADHLGIRYIYGEDLPTTPSPGAPQISALTKDALNVMPTSWVQQLYQAAIAIDDDLIIQLIQQIPQSQSSLANLLTDLVNNFRLDVIVDCIREGE